MDFKDQEKNTQTDDDSSPVEKKNKKKAPVITTVQHAIHKITANVQGKTVAEVREELGSLLHIDPEAVAVVDGEEVDENFILNQCPQMHFVKRASDKGAK